MAKDIFHSHVRLALEKDGWEITDDPLLLPWGTAPVYVDLGADKIIAAEKKDRKIAVEVKSFLRGSRTEDLEDAMGQIVLYRYLLQRSQPERELFLAVRQDVYESYISLPHVIEFLRTEQVNLLVFDPQTEEVVQWIKWNNTETSSSDS
ncbi:MAG: element excision factor XisH family protein [Blastocatellia bacterium]